MPEMSLLESLGAVVEHDGDYYVSTLRSSTSPL